MLTGTLTPTSNKADWIESLALDDAETGDPVDISNASEIVIEVRGGSNCLRLSASLTAGSVTRVQTGVFQWQFSASQMSGLEAGTYQVLCRITKDDQVVQLIIGSLPVLDG
jgi:cell division protein YceG involved in septum cleavage